MKHVIATIHITGESPIIQSHYHEAPKEEKEKAADYEKRTWREKCNYDADGEVVIPAFAIKNAITDAAKRSGDKIEGKGNKKWGKIIETGVTVITPAKLGVKKDDVSQVQIFCSARGFKNDGTRVMRRFPIIHEWEAELEIIVYDLSIDKDTLYKYVREAGLFIGFGSFRVANGGSCGRFTPEPIEKMKWVLMGEE